MENKTSNFFSKKHPDWPQPNPFQDQSNKVYFIEDRVTRQWLSIDISQWTIDPHDALSFPNYFKASTFANRNMIYGKAGVIITEHLFIDPVT